jgi:hypothetical protein
VLYKALVARTRADDLAENCELPDSEFLREVGFVLKRHGDAREMMFLRPFELRANGHFGLLCKFSLRVPPTSSLPEKTRLELSLTHKNGRTNEDFYLDHRGKTEWFLNTYFDPSCVIAAS